MLQCSPFQFWLPNHTHDVCKSCMCRSDCLDWASFLTACQEGTWRKDPGEGACLHSRGIQAWRQLRPFQQAGMVLSSLFASTFKVGWSQREEYSRFPIRCSCTAHMCTCDSVVPLKATPSCCLNPKIAKALMAETFDVQCS